MIKAFERNIVWYRAVLFIVFFPSCVYALNITDERTLPHIEIYPISNHGSFVEGSTFDVPIIINTNNESIKAIKLFIKYDKNKIAIVKPSGGVSVVDTWVEPPSYDNSTGIVSYIGEIPDGLVTQAGLISTITFKALNTGKAFVNIEKSSQVILNNDLNTPTIIDSHRSEYVILQKASGGVLVFSETHPVESKWYNNNNPVLSWVKDAGVTGFSFILDDKPSTIPDNIVDSEQTTTSFENLKDGLWYFHIKAQKAGVWGTTGHFLIRIDTAPPAEFLPTTNNSLANVVVVRRTLVSFLTTDNLSGVDHYEVGVIDESQPVTKSPVFIQTESPFQVPFSEYSTTKVIVRAFDKAGNIREGFLRIKPSFNIIVFIDTYFKLIIIILLCILMFYIFMRYNKKKNTYAHIFGAVDNNLRKYISEQKDLHQQQSIEKERIENLKKELSDVERVLNTETKDDSM